MINFPRIVSFVCDSFKWCYIVLWIQPIQFIGELPLLIESVVIILFFFSYSIWDKGKIRFAVNIKFENQFNSEKSVHLFAQRRRTLWHFVAAIKFPFLK